MHNPAQLREMVEEAINNMAWPPSPDKLYKPMEYIMGLGGKRMRPIATLMAVEMLKGDLKKAVQPALAVETFHNFTLIHDDIMDQAPIRRGKSTVHTKWNENVGILSGDGLLIKAYQCFEGLRPEAFKMALVRFNQTALEVCEGQQLDMDYAEAKSVTLQDYLNMIRFKTAVLLGYAFELGGILSGASQKDCESLFKMGCDMGIGFQIHDDHLDAFADPEKFGKKVGGDIAENKHTYLFIALKSIPEAEVPLNQALSVSDENEKIEAVKALYQEFGVDQAALKAADVYYEKACSALENIEAPSEKKEMISALIQELRQRDR